MIAIDLLVSSLVLSGIFMLGLGIFGWRNRNRIPMALPYALLMGAAAGWAFLYALDLLAGSLPEKVLYHNLRFLILPFIPVLELWLVLAYVDRQAWLRPVRVAALLIIPACTAVLALTSQYHALFRSSFSISESPALPVLHYIQGPFYQFYTLYNLVLLVLIYGALVYGTWKQGTLRDTRTVLLIVALVVPTVITYLFEFGITPVPGVNMTAPLLWVPAVLYTLAIFRYRFLDIVPQARDHVIETMSTPMLVLDTEGRVIDHNQAAGGLFTVPGGNLRGRMIGEVSAAWPAFLACCRPGEHGTFRLERQAEGGTQSWILSVDQLAAPAGEAAGQVLILRDITDLETTRDALRESERKYRNLYRYAEVGLFETSLSDETVIACNQMYADLAGFDSPEEAAGQDVRSIYVHPGERDLVIRQLRETGKVENMVAQFRNRKTGAVFTGRFSARWDRGRDVAEGTIIDISKLREAEEQIRHLASFPQLTPILVMEVDRSGKTLFLNPAMQAALDSAGISDPLAFMPPGYLDRLAGTSPEAFTQWKDEITINGHSYEETTYYTPEFDTLRVYATDVTERKSAQEALRQSEALYREFFTTSRDAVFITTVEGHWVDFNETALEIFGYDDRTDLLALPLPGLYERPEDRDEIITRIRAEGYIRDYPVRLRKKDGSVIDTLVTAAALQEQDGTPKALIGSIRDIAVQKEMEQALRESEGRLQAIIQGSPIPTFVIDQAHRVISWNRAIEELTGITPADMLGTDQQWRAFYPVRRPVLADLLLDAAIDRIAALYAGKTRPSPLIDGAYEVTDFFPKLGRNGKWLFFTASPIRDQNGTLIGAVETLEDITDRKLAEEALRESNAYLNNLLDYSNVPMIVWDPGFRVIRFNHAFEHLTGRTEQELLGQHLDLLFPEESKAASLELIKKTLAGEQWETVEVPVLTIEGEARTVLWNSANIAGPDGEIISTIAQGTDITERIAAEHQREAVIRELEQKNAELERFTYTVSHDLKSPLITIKGFLGLLREDALRGNIPKMEHDIRRISAATETMQLLLSDLLTLSRIGRVVNPPERVNFGAIAAEATEVLAGTIGESGVCIVIDPGLPDVFADHARIREVLTNLVENAIKFRGDQPDPRVEIGAVSREEETVFFVRDNGVGLEQKYANRVFNLFEKLDPKSEGTGVGLAIVRRIIEVHGGRVWMESAGPGKGTTVFFTLPLVEGPEK